MNRIMDEAISDLFHRMYRMPENVTRRQFRSGHAAYTSRPTGRNRFSRLLQLVRPPNAGTHMNWPHFLDSVHRRPDRRLPLHHHRLHHRRGPGRRRMSTLGFILAGWIGWSLWAGLCWAGVLWAADNTRMPAGALTVLLVVASVGLPLILIFGVVL